MSLQDEEERKRRGLWYTIITALEEAREFLPDAMKDKNSIVGSIFSIIMQGVEFFKKISVHFSMYPADSRQNLSSEELQAEGAQAFLDKIKTLNLSDQHRAQLLDKWRQDPKDRSLAWVALAEHGLHLGEQGVHCAQMIIDERLADIENKVAIKLAAEDRPENILDKRVAAEFSEEIFLIEKAELEQIAINNELKMALLYDKQNQDSDQYHDHQSLLQEGKEQLKNILEVGKIVITRYYDMYKDNAAGIPAPAVVQNNRPDHHVLHEEFEGLNRRLNRAQLP